MELSLLLHAGLTVSDGISLMLDDSGGADAHALLTELARAADTGLPLSQALEQTGAFPEYMVQMVLTGERSGRLEEALRALSEYYERRQRLSARIRTALLYPAILLALMLVVIGVLTVKILPVFDQVYQQLGSRLTGLGGGLLRFGQALSSALPAILIVLAVIAVLAAVCAAVPALRGRISAWYASAFGGRGINYKIAAARVASAMAMGMNSGLPMEESLELAASFQKGNPHMLRRVNDCLARLRGGDAFSDALTLSGIFPSTYCRMIALGMRSGAGDQMMTEVAGRMDDDAQETIERSVGRVEPALVIVSSVIVGVIILAVMLPLMNIMSSIG